MRIQLSAHSHKRITNQSLLNLPQELQEVLPVGPAESDSGCLWDIVHDALYQSNDLTLVTYCADETSCFGPKDLLEQRPQRLY